MMRPTLLFACCSVASLCFLVSPALGEMPGSDPDALWHYITKTSPYTQWSFWPDHQGMQKGNAPHGPLHKVYVNDAALNSKKPPVAHGSILVKENYGRSQELRDITVMYKLMGFYPEKGDWFWAKFSPDGKAQRAGKPRGCINCHSSGEDFILTHEFK